MTFDVRGSTFVVCRSEFVLLFLRLGGAENGEPPNAEPERRTANAEPRTIVS
jgi:hypothetical protein